MKRLIIIVFTTACNNLVAQNQLAIPPSITGSSFNLNVQNGTKIFYGTKPTPTYGINGVWMSPTIIVNKGDNITLNVSRGLAGIFIVKDSAEATLNLPRTIGGIN